MKKSRVLLLGAMGRIGSDFIIEYLKNYSKDYDLILGVHDKKFKAKDFKVKYFSLENMDSLKKAMKKIDIVVNLAANPNPNSKFKDLIKPNLIGCYNVFEAAIKMKVKRIVFASSVQAIKGYGYSKIVSSIDAPKPDNLYGATKVFGEALCYVFSQNNNLSCLALRIGAYTSDVKLKTVCFSRKDYQHVISQYDMAQLIHKSIIAPKKIKYGILSGTSKNKKLDMNLAETKKLIGYNPKDDAYNLCKKLRIKK